MVMNLGQLRHHTTTRHHTVCTDLMGGGPGTNWGSRPLEWTLQPDTTTFESLMCSSTYRNQVILTAVRVTKLTTTLTIMLHHTESMLLLVIYKHPNICHWNTDWKTSITHSVCYHQLRWLWPLAYIFQMKLKN